LGVKLVDGTRRHNNFEILQYIDVIKAFSAVQDFESTFEELLVFFFIGTFENVYSKKKKNTF